ncbi:ACT domain-containing protein, partial [Kitasatospora sp. NPDC005856]|uniref:ACT domain-containing protein n=1 Tax=Kitasatospora sp. NPDC005856 TaxID=3154566 RepID=UPI0033E6B793
RPLRRAGTTAHTGRCGPQWPPDRSRRAVHRRMRADGRAELEVRWQPQGAPAAGHRVTLRAEALNRPRLLADLTAAISGAGVGIVSAEVEPPQESRVRHTYTVELPEPAALPGLMRAMLKVSGVYDVSRPQAPEGGREPGERPLGPVARGKSG